jgi:hypothetical protein
MPPEPQPQLQRPNSLILASSSALLTMSPEASTSNLNAHHNGPIRSRTESDVGSPKSSTDSDTNQTSLALPSDRSTKSLRKRISAVIRRNSPPTNSSGEEIPPVPKLPMSKETEDVAGPRFQGPSTHTEGKRMAGDWINVHYCLIQFRVHTLTKIFPEFPAG